MRIANLAGRAGLLHEGCAVDVERASAGAFGADPQGLYDDWAAFTAWASGVDVAGHPQAVSYEPRDLGCPVPRPSQVFAIGLNYADHAAESQLEVPEHPVVFTKFASSLAGPDVEVSLSGERVDWEAELVVVVGSGGRGIDAGQAWDHVAGLAVGQDLSDRTVQSRGAPAQFSLGKSFAGYAPVGPAVVTLDELAGHDVDDLRISCEVTEDGGTRVLQEGSTGSMVFGVAELLARLSDVVELRPGDLLFTGTPAGVGLGRRPQEFLKPGQVLTTRIEGLGEIRQQLR